MDHIIIFLALSVTLFGCSKELIKPPSNDDYIATTFKPQSGYSYLNLKALEKESGSYQPAAFLINGIWFHHYKKEPLILTVSEGCFDIRVSSVSKLPYIIEDLHISSGDSVVLDIKMEDDLSPLID